MGITVALASTTYGAIATTWGFRHVFEILIEWAVNWLANKGLMVLNIAAISVQGDWDQKAFDKAMDEALGQVAVGGLTPAQMKEIDDKVITAFRKFAVFRTP